MPGLESAGGGGVPLEKLSEGTLTADGTEQTVVELTSRGELEGFIDLANMASGNTLTIRLYVKMRDGGTYRLYDSASYTDTQTNPALHISRLPSEYGVKVTLQQTAGVNKTYDFIFHKRG